MKIVHNISVNVNSMNESGRPPEKQGAMDTLRSLGIVFKGPDNDLVPSIHFRIYESDPLWPELQPLIAKWEAFDSVGTEFSKEEIETAAFLELSAREKGYPYPKPGGFGYLKATYDLTEYCDKCGSGKRQAAPFHMKGEPKWGKVRMSQLIWVWDQFFVPPAVWDDVFRPLGIGRLPVLHYKTREELQTVVQLEINRTADSPLLMGDEYPSEICASCGRKKFDPISRGFFPRFVADPPYDIFWTQECFGGGLDAWSATIISHKVYAAMRDNKVDSVRFTPLAPAVG